MRIPPASLKKNWALILLALPLAYVLPESPGESLFSAGVAAGFSGSLASIDYGFASAGPVGLGIGLAITNPWDAFAPAGELRVGAAVYPWKSGVMIHSAILGGAAQIPQTGLGAPYGGLVFGADFPLQKTRLSIRIETAFRFGGREYEVSASNPAGTVRYVDTWEPPFFDASAGLRWRF